MAVAMSSKGLLSAALAADGRLYAWGTDAITGATVLIRVLGETVWEELLRIEQPDRNHNGGCLGRPGWHAVP